MKYNHLDMLPERAFIKVGGQIKPQGGGGGAPTSTNNTTTTIPEYARPYVESTLGKAAAVTDLTQNPYQPYKGEQVAQFTPMQNQAFQNVGNQQIAPQIADASNIAYQTGQYGLGAQGTAAQLQNASLGYGAMAAGAGDRYSQQATNPAASQAYMNPYLQASLQPALQEVQRQYDITGTQQMGNAARSGAFGGSREALMASENQRNKNLAMNQMIGQGYNTAFDKAQQSQQFGATLGLQGLQAGQQGVQGAVGAGQYGLAGLGQAGASAGTLGQLGQTQFGQEQAANQAMVSAGTQQQALQQKGLDAAYQQYQAQLNYPYQQLGFMSDLLRGLPLTQQSTSMYQNPSMISQAAGIGTAGMGMYGMYNMMNKANGGQIKEKRMADGGITQLFDVGGAIKSDLSRMSPQELQEYIAESSSPTAKRMAQQLLAEKIAIARMQQNPGVTQLPSNLPTGETMAGGGIIAFAGEDQSLVRDKEIAEREAADAAGTTSSASGVDTLVAQPPTRLPAAGATSATSEKSVYGDMPLMSPEAKEAFSQYASLYKDMRGDNKKAREEAKYMALIQAGFGIAGGTSPNAFANINQGVQPAMAQYQAAIKDIRKDDREAVKGLIELGLTKEKFMQEVQKMGIDVDKAQKAYDATIKAAEINNAGRLAAATAGRQPRSTTEGDITAAQIKNGADKIIRANPNMSRGDAEYQAYMEITTAKNPPQSNTAGVAGLASAEDAAVKEATKSFDKAIEIARFSNNDKRIADLTRQRSEAAETARTQFRANLSNMWSQSNRPPATGGSPAAGSNPATTFLTNPQATARPAAPAAGNTGAANNFIVGRAYSSNGITKVYKGKDKSNNDIWE